MGIEFINHYYTGRIYQYYLDNEENLIKGLINELNFLVPKFEGIEISKLKKLVNKLVEEDGVIIKCCSLPKRSGWKFNFRLDKKTNCNKQHYEENYNFDVGM